MRAVFFLADNKPTLHEDIRESLCRICGTIIKEKYTKSKCGFAEELMTLYHVNVLKDDEKIYSKYICNNHTVLLYKLRKKEVSTISCELFPFPELASCTTLLPCNACNVYYKSILTIALYKQKLAKGKLLHDILKKYDQLDSFMQVQCIS